MWNTSQYCGFCEIKLLYEPETTAEGVNWGMQIWRSVPFCTKSVDPPILLFKSAATTTSGNRGVKLNSKVTGKFECQCTVKSFMKTSAQLVSQTSTKTNQKKPGTKSKNKLRRVTLGILPLWEIHSLTPISLVFTQFKHGYNFLRCAGHYNHGQKSWDQTNLHFESFCANARLEYSFVYVTNKIFQFCWWSWTPFLRLLFAQRFKVHLTPKYSFAQINLCTCLIRVAPFCPLLTQILSFYSL